MTAPEKPDGRYVIGIDLGTTNSAVAYVDLDAPSPRQIKFLSIPQLIAPGQMGNQPILPSFVYLAGPHELPQGSTALPWDPDRNYVVGQFAREQGALVPGRLVSSAKSWLAHSGVDRAAPILPWTAGEDVKRISPVEASSRYLLHMKEAWNESIGRQNGSLFEEQTVILTVPASFDEVARELTVTAATRAGIPKLLLLEEPLAAFYAWLFRHEKDWQEIVREGELILVCDVGGGTTDFTVLAVRRSEKGLRFDRLAVGDHLILGGDNMDLALARHIETELQPKTRKQLDARAWHQLWHRCSQAKETLLASDNGGESKKNAVEIILMGSGGRVIGDMLKYTLTIDQVEEQILEGFFPFASLEDLPDRKARPGLAEMGLPYAQDPAITHHLGHFWRTFLPLLKKETGRSAPFPEFLLFNGGALNPPSIRRRLREVVGRWFQPQAGTEWMPSELENPQPELAVARGAAYYGLVRMGEGTRVGAGSPRSYFIQVGGAETGEKEIKSVCLVPRGAEEGFEKEFSDIPFQVLTNQPVVFQVLSSSTRLGDRPGDIVAIGESEALTLPPLRTALRFGKKGEAQPLPIHLLVHLTEIGVLELWCQSRQTSHRWQLQFDIRQEGKHDERPPGETLDSEVVDLACSKIRSVFDEKTSSPEILLKDLTTVLDAKKEEWSSLLVRKLADVLVACRAGRTISAHHESRWLNLTGFCLRPGFGDPVDEWRIREAWKMYPSGLQFPREAQGRSEWWIFWRRIAGGLTAGQQWQLFQNVWPGLQASDPEKKRISQKAWRGHEELEIWMMLANLERLPAKTKEEIGDLLLAKLEKKGFRPQDLWIIGRLGSRTPFYGPVDRTLSNRAAARWLHALLSHTATPTPAMGQALIHLARRTGDRQRDLSQEERDRVHRWLEQLPDRQHLQAVLSDPDTPFGREEQQRVFGESLPSGLILSP